ncbi:hypothetical protein RJ639_024468 [Escallonia herrerae]|uniref:CCHC-type domain-containing protein n=1 Tax=Escallonia herrerae TaxID=1293975 RepID=A0AA89ADN3_9ASTE|nr:hypothetical protein RJ639_024468 [Escallonia herrerae]
MSENSSVVDHLNDFNGVTNQLESVGINFDDEIRALLFMCSLPDSWNNLVTTVSNSTISGTLTLNDVVSSVMNDEIRRKTIGDGISSSTALSVESRGRQNNRGRCPTRGRSRSRGKSKSKGKTIVCWNCNKEGHKKNDCTEPKKKKGARGRQGDDEGANMDVRHIPELQKNLISASGLDREGYFVVFGEKQWKVIKGSMVVARGERVGTLYTLSCTHSHSISLAFTENQRTTLWHHRLGHLSESGMKILYSKNALPGMKNIQLDFCEGCVYGKQKRDNFRRDGKEKKIERLELVHTDVCGPTTFWAAAVDTVVYLINRSPTSALNGGIPEEEWSSDEYGYRLWDYEHNKIIRSRNVIFDETWLYKNRLQEHGIEKENKEYMKLDEPEDGQVLRTENPEVLDETTDTEIGVGDQQQVPETLNLRRSSRDDMLVAGSSMGRINELKKKLASTFSMKDLGEAKQLLGMKITRDRKQKKLWLSQEEYIDKLLEDPPLEQALPVTLGLVLHYLIHQHFALVPIVVPTPVPIVVPTPGPGKLLQCIQGHRILLSGSLFA